MTTMAAVSQVAFQQTPSDRTVSAQALESAERNLTQDQLIVSRAVTLLELTFRNARAVGANKPLLFWKRMELIAAILERLYEQASVESLRTTGSKKRFAIRVAEYFQFTPLQLVTLYFTRTTPTECSRILESVLLKTNAEITRLHPKSKAHLLH